MSRKRRVAFRMASSPVENVVRATTGASSTKWSVWSPKEKVQLLSNGDNTMHTNMPKREVSRDQ